MRPVNADELKLFYNNISVIYNNDKERYKDVIKKLYKEYLKRNTSHIPIVNCLYIEMRSALRAMLGGISPFIKNNAFKNEKEWRIANYIFDDDSAKIYKRITHKLNFINYIRTDIPLSALKFVVIGPCADYEKVRNLLMKVSTDYGIKKMGEEKFYKKSQVPYREL